MKALNFIIENWYFIVTAIVMIAMAIIIAVNFFNLPAKEQTAKVKEWLLFAVTEAEKQLGDGTGQLKLRQVYDLFVQRFPAVALAVSFETFSAWVDEALEQMRNMLDTNVKAAAYVESGVLAQEIIEGVGIDG